MLIKDLKCPNSSRHLLDASWEGKSIRITCRGCRYSSRVNPEVWVELAQALSTATSNTGA